MSNTAEYWNNGPDAFRQRTNGSSQNVSCDILHSSWCQLNLHWSFVDCLQHKTSRKFINKKTILETHLVQKSSRGKQFWKFIYYKNHQQENHSGNSLSTYDWCFMSSFKMKWFHFKKTRVTFSSRENWVKRFLKNGKPKTKCFNKWQIKSLSCNLHVQERLLLSKAWRTIKLITHYTV